MHLLMVGTTAPSHDYPSLGVIAEPVRRGHRVSYGIGDRLATADALRGPAPVAAQPRRVFFAPFMRNVASHWIDVSASPDWL